MDKVPKNYIFFDANDLSSEDKKGFDIIYPEWNEMSFFEKPDWCSIRMMLKTVKLHSITEYHRETTSRKLTVSMDNMRQSNTIIDVDYSKLYSQLYADKENDIHNAPEIQIDFTKNDDVKPKNITTGSIIVDQSKVAMPYGFICSDGIKDLTSVITGCAQYIKGNCAVQLDRHFIEAGFLETPMTSFKMVIGDKDLEEMLRCIRVLECDTFESCIEAVYSTDSICRREREIFKYTDFSSLFGITLDALRSGKRSENANFIRAVRDWIEGNLQTKAAASLMAVTLFDIELDWGMQEAYYDTEEISYFEGDIG
ncbi:hypothetical protein K450DRAFT_282240 [Umbelopsis ramanniana AG]|uniref:Uncharacterized protein n=1 Tax=Umbelopsis ramanniana AG TaxID=1314678 RepID=A0AAD5E8W5_UMBRA|nr:uncharacterized protein K450DRAFT_282240 [Umbelopsis ramanniana AG]KAI8577780.1 hypothetical protein K450DRAFT_282240 [Umbelopsis ramanniana AG]